MPFVGQGLKATAAEAGVAVGRGVEVGVVTEGVVVGVAVGGTGIAAGVGLLQAAISPAARAPPRARTTRLVHLDLIRCTLPFLSAYLHGRHVLLTVL